MPTDLKTNSTHVLPRRVRVVEVRVVEQALSRGTAGVDDINGYATAQLELAARNDLDSVLDPRD